MPAIFNLIRACLLGAVAVWTVIVLGIAIHFQTIFESSPQLTYVSLAVFISALTLCILLSTLFAPCSKVLATILKTKWELLWLGALAVLWLGLAGYTATPFNTDTEVECWGEIDGEIVEAEVEAYSTEVYHARYRVLQAFSFFNAILLLILFLFILLLAVWHHKRGRFVIWTTPTTSVGWFDRPDPYAYGRRLPEPVTSKRGKNDKNDKYTQLSEEKIVKKLSEGPYRMDNKRPSVEKKKDYTSIPAPAVTRQNTTGKPKEFVTYVPADQAKKPTPIAARMTQSRPQERAPERQTSRRETADAARQEARRNYSEREDSDDRNPFRNPRRQETSSKPAAVGTTRPSQPRRTNTTQTQADKPAVKPSVVRQQSTSQPRPTRQASGAARAPERRL